MNKLKKGSKEAKMYMAKIRNMRGKTGKMKGNGLLKDIFDKAKDILIDKAHSYVKDKQIISKGLAGLSVAQPELAPITAPLSAGASLLGYGKKRNKKLMF